MRPVIQENLLNQGGYIGHQVNCKGVMGAGIALQIRNQYPVVYSRYREFCRSKEPASLLGMVQPVTITNELVILNLFGQEGYGRTGCHTDYEALRVIAGKLIARGLIVHLPYGMGCGLAGGDWQVVAQIFDKVPGCWYKL